MTKLDAFGRAFAELVERTSDGLLLLDATGSIEYANARAEAILAHDGALEGTPVSRWLPGIELPAARPAVDTETEAVSARMERFPVEVAVTPLQDGLRAWVAFRDLSRRRGFDASVRKYSQDLEKIVRKRARELDDVRRRYRTLYDLAPVLDFELDSQGSIASANRKSCVSLGVPIDRLIGLPLTGLAAPEGRDDLEQKIDRVRHGSVTTFETKLRSSNGSVIDVAFHATLNSGEGRASVRLVGLDVTARYEAEKLVDQSLHLTEAQRARMERILRGIGEGLLVMDADGQVRLMNSVAEHLFEVKESLAFGRNLLAESRDHDFVEAWLEFLSGQEELLKGEILIDSPREQVLLVTASRFRTLEGRPAGIVAVLRDVSQERAETRRTLDFLSNVTQELRAPLSSIRGFTATVLRGEKVASEERMRFLEIVEAEALRLQHLIEDLSALASLESGRESFRPSTANFTTLLDETKDRLAPQAAARGVALEVTSHGDSGSGVFDPEKIHRVLDNLVDNALRFTAAGGKVEVELWREADRFECAVHDMGRGIAPEVLDSIFNCFSSFAAGQAHPPGTGLGLHISRRIVELHGGEISATSRLGEGSTFRFWIPVEPKTRIEGKTEECDVLPAGHPLEDDAEPSEVPTSPDAS